MTDRPGSRLRDLPSVDLLLQGPQALSWIDRFGRPLTVEAVRTVLDDIRRQVRLADGGAGEIPQESQIFNRIAETLEDWVKPTLLAVINATGVVLHTNLGRAPLSTSAVNAMQAVALGYSNLEYDLERGTRGTRLIHAEALLRRLTGAEAALVVNNNAAALLLGLTALARRRRVIISRSQLVEIGGGFRVPEVMSQSGAKLVEVGTTNRVHVADYAEALQEGAALVMRAHHSNFRIIGFTTEPNISEMVKVAHQYGVPVLDDLGSGVLVDTARYGLAHEPTVQESLEAGADLVCFSGDKLLGGPQAGIIVGQAKLVAKLKKHPLARAVRADKLALAGLSATLLHYLKDEAECEVPVWQMIAASGDDIRRRAGEWLKELGTGEVIAGESTVGGGSLPEETLPSWLLALNVRQPNRFLARLRKGSPPVIARVQADRVVLDPRTVLPAQDAVLLKVVENALDEERK